MHIPLTTYRLQLHEHFTFADAEKILPYLKAFGVTDIYLSPILSASKHSQHGYDVIDFRVINPVLGGEADFLHLANRCRYLQLNLVIDLVPNHMAATEENIFWQDVLHQRTASPYKDLFDINWLASNDGPLVYRRFFDINELVCLHTEKPEIYALTHRWLHTWLHAGHIHGIRVDHPDGLRDPLVYLERLAQMAPHTYRVVEKILAYDEQLPSSWPVAGTTGYDFLAHMNQLFVKPEGLHELIHHYQDITGETRDLTTLIAQAGHDLISNVFHCEFIRLVNELQELLGGSRASLRDMLMPFVITLGRYRCYADDEASRKQIKAIARIYKSRSKRFTQLLALLCLDFPDNITPAMRSRWQKWHTNWEVLTGPIAAKAFEDTVCYQYCPLLSLNEVGMGPPFYSGCGNKENWHNFILQRQAQWPHSMNASSTHDTKRSEDMRARLNVLSELSESWQQQFTAWMSINQRFKTQLEQDLAPDVTDEYYLYQTLLGMWPLEETPLADIEQRLSTHLNKAARERKVHSTWAKPNDAYEQAWQHFLARILRHPPFMQAFNTFHAQIAFYGIYNSLMQLVLKTMCPGVCDIYQGNEGWRFDLVDPDNRRPINFTKISDLNSAEPLNTLLEQWHSGQIKFNLQRQLLHIRRHYAALINHGEYLPLHVNGPEALHIIAFARRNEDKWLIVILCRWFSQLINVDESWISNSIGESTIIELPTRLQLHHSLLTYMPIEHATRQLNAKHVLRDFPCAIFYASE